MCFSVFICFREWDSSFFDKKRFPHFYHKANKTSSNTEFQSRLSHQPQMTFHGIQCYSLWHHSHHSQKEKKP
jgi:hypothetical protein